VRTCSLLAAAYLWWLQQCVVVAAVCGGCSSVWWLQQCASAGCVITKNARWLYVGGIPEGTKEVRSCAFWHLQ
jgi:hypothetical protein